MSGEILIRFQSCAREVREYRLIFHASIEALIKSGRDKEISSFNSAAYSYAHENFMVTNCIHWGFTLNFDLEPKCSSVRAYGTSKSESMLS